MSNPDLDLANPKSMHKLKVIDFCHVMHMRITYSSYKLLDSVCEEAHKSL